MSAHDDPFAELVAGVEIDEGTVVLQAAREVTFASRDVMLAVVAMLREELGPDHPETVRAADGLGVILALADIVTFPESDS